jgi:DNA-directed RNA polymerase specialized sigma24 family protein
MKRRAKSQKTKVLERPDIYKGERSPYWDDAKARIERGGQDNIYELAQANPDVLPETEISAPSTPQLLMGEAVTHLQGRQKEVYLLTMREGKSLAEAAEILGIEKGSVQRYKERAVKFLTQYCQAAINKGRI